MNADVYFLAVTGIFQIVGLEFASIMYVIDD